MRFWQLWHWSRKRWDNYLFWMSFVVGGLELLSTHLKLYGQKNTCEYFKLLITQNLSSLLSMPAHPTPTLNQSFQPQMQLLWMPKQLSLWNVNFEKRQWIFMTCRQLWRNQLLIESSNQKNQTLISHCHPGQVMWTISIYIFMIGCADLLKANWSCHSTQQGDHISCRKDNLMKSFITLEISEMSNPLSKYLGLPWIIWFDMNQILLAILRPAEDLKFMHAGHSLKHLSAHTCTKKFSNGSFCYVINFCMNTTFILTCTRLLTCLL